MQLQIIPHLHLKRLSIEFKKKCKPGAFLLSRPKMILSVNELEGISHLLEAGLTLPQTFHLALSPKHRPIVEQLRQTLQNGDDLNRLFPSFCPLSWALYLKGLMPMLGFSRGLRLTRMFIAKQRQTFHELRRRILYPLSLLLSATTASVLFTELVCPSLLRMAAGLHADIKPLHSARILLRLITGGIILFLLFALLLFAFASKQNFKVRFYHLLAKYFPQALPILYWSVSFVCFFTESLRCGHATKQTLQIIESLETQPVLSTMAASLRKDLEEGEDLVAAVHKCRMDPLLEQMLHIAVHTNEPAEILDSYLSFSLKRMQDRIRFHIKILQLTAYALLGFMLIVVYRVLLMPLSVFQTL